MNAIKRNPQIDVARGIGMLLVVLGHCHYTLTAPVNRIILSFHMPLFFILSGLVAKTYEVAKTPGGGYTLNKIRTILLPQIMLGIISYIYDVLFRVVMKGGSIGDVDILYSFWRWWFLPVLFLTELFFYFLSMVLDYKKREARIGVIAGTVLLSGLCIYVIPFPDESPFFVNVVPVAFFFYFSGYCLKEALTASLQEKKMSVRIGITIGATILCVASALLNTSVTMFNNGYGNLVLFLVSAFSGSLLVWMIAGFCTKSNALRWIGLHSLYVYVWQFKVTDFMKNIAEIACGRIHITSPEVMVGVAFVLSLAILVPLVVLSDKFIPFMFGKKAKRQ